MAVSERLLTAWKTGCRQPSSDLSLDDEASAYAVQQKVASALGWPRQSNHRVWKLGGAPGGMISAALVPELAVHGSGWRVPSTYSMGLGIESEIAIRLSHDLNGSEEELEVFNAIDEWMPAIELCDTRFVDGGGENTLLKLADQQMSRALIVGAASKLTSAHDWKLQRAQLKVDGQIRFDQSGSHPFGSPLSNVVWLARHAASQGMPLMAGDVIATGSWSGLSWINEGQAVEVDFHGIGEVLLKV
ncbi:hypothetical protein KKK_11300 [Pseudomonas putida B6-2]|nr:hypothetical protein KKK_11300 [Pseudomonas putida B6-2]